MSAARSVSWPLAQIPNALTLARLLVIPVYAVLILSSEDGHSWPAAILFGCAAITDQIDGYLARRGMSSRSSGRSPTRSPTAC